MLADFPGDLQTLDGWFQVSPQVVCPVTSASTDRSPKKKKKPDLSEAISTSSLEFRTEYATNLEWSHTRHISVWTFLEAQSRTRRRGREEKRVEYTTKILCQETETATEDKSI